MSQPSDEEMNRRYNQRHPRWESLTAAMRLATSKRLTGSETEYWEVLAIIDDETFDAAVTMAQLAALTDGDA